MQTPLVSIVLPVYNAEAYLDRCLESIVEQSYANIQIIVVDDGSKDNSVQIIQNYLTDDRIKFIQKPNSGPSDTRNLAVSHAQGEYLSFIDADDYLQKDYVEKLLTPFLQHPEIDLVVSNYIELAPYNVNGTSVSQIAKNEIITDFKKLLFQGTMGVLWGKMFRTSIIRTYQLELPAEIHFQEDLVFVAQYAQHCKVMYGITDYLYYYNRLNENSITSKLSPSLLKEFNKVQTKLLELYQNTPIHKLVQNRYNQFYQSYLISRAKQLDYQEFKKEVQSLDFKKYILSPDKKLYKPYFILLKNNFLPLAFAYIKLISFIKNK